MRQNADESLGGCILLAKSSLRGYGLRDRVLVHVVEGDCGEEIVRVVVPKVDRGRLLNLAHDDGGHLGIRKVRDKLNRLFTWPGLAAWGRGGGGGGGGRPGHGLANILHPFHTDLHTMSLGVASINTTWPGQNPFASPAPGRCDYLC